MKSFNEIPFSSELLDLFLPAHLSGSGKLNPVKRRNFSLMKDLLEIDYDSFFTWYGAGLKKWNALEEVKSLLTTKEGQENVEAIYEHCMVTHEFPENLTMDEEELSLEDKIGIAIKQYINYLEKIAYYKNIKSLKSDAERIKLLFVDQFTQEEIATKLNLSRERVRQLKVKYINGMFGGELSNASNLKFSDSFKQEISFFLEQLPTICSHKTLCEKLQCDDYNNSTASLLLNLRTAPERAKSLNSQPYSTFDQLYYISPDISVSDTCLFIKSICEVLGRGAEYFDVRPMTIDEIMGLLEESNEEFDFESEIVHDILEQHTWIETVSTDDETKYQLKYKFLKNDYNFIGRMVYELGRVNISDIDEIHKQRTGISDCKSILKSIGPAKNKFPWVVTGGVNGVLEYNESGNKRARMINSIKDWIGEHKKFTFSEIMSDLKSMGYTNLQERTIRTYIMKNCYVENKNANLFCNSLYVDEFSEGYSWRQKTQSGLTNWIVCHVHKYLLEARNNQLPVSVLEENLKKLDSVEHFRLRHPLANYVYNYIKGENALFVINDKQMKLTQRGLQISEDDLNVLGVRSRKPDYYDVVISKIIDRLNESSEGKMQLSDLRNECLAEIEELTQASFYRIVSRYLPEQIVKVELGNNTYLKLDREKIEYADALVIKPTQVGDSINEPIVIKEEGDRPIRELGKTVVVDWDELRKDFIFQLNFNSRQWNLEMSFTEGVEKFIRFIKRLDSYENGRLARQLPRYFMQFWHYQNDMYSHVGYMTEIVVCYEKLLREIHRANSGVNLATKGLSDTIHMIDDVNKWMEQGEMDACCKSVRRLWKDRNKVAHGEEIAKNLTEMVINITQYIFLYIYTVAKFWEEKQG